MADIQSDATLHYTADANILNRYIPDETELTTAKNYANWLKGFKDVGNQRQWPHFLCHSLYIHTYIKPKQ